MLEIILPMATEDYSISPSLSQRLYLNELGILSSIGQLKSSDAGTYMISSSQFHGTLALTLSISGMTVLQIMLCNNVALYNYS